MNVRKLYGNIDNDNKIIIYNDIIVAPVYCLLINYYPSKLYSASDDD